MNKIILLGRLVKAPDVSYSNSETPTLIARYTLAVDRRIKKNDGQTADFIDCVVFGKAAEFAEKYFGKGTQICISGRLQIDVYKDKENKTARKTYVIVENQEFVQNKSDKKETDFNSDDSGDLPF